MGQEFWIRADGYEWRQVDKAEYVRIERLAGFRNTMGQPAEPATASFSGRGWRGMTWPPDDLHTMPA